MNFILKNKTIEINTNRKDFFFQYPKILEPIFNDVLTSINGQDTVIRKRELEILSELLYYHDLYKDLEEKDRYKAIFSRDVKTQIRKRLNLHNLHVSPG